MNPLISVIVPVYKVEPYLRKCVDSILAQTYTNLEVILVDDGSPDNCGAICDAYAAKDSRVKVIHKENGGQSSARNAGLQVMRGEYVSFVDSDDWLAEDLYESIMAFAPFSAALFGCTYVDDETGEIRTKQACYESGELIWAEDAEQIGELVKNSLFGYAWNKIFRADVVKSLSYPIALLREDLLFNMAAFSRTGRIFLHNHIGYYYRQRVGSALSKDYCGLVPDIVGVAEQMLLVHPLLPSKVNERLRSHLIKNYICDMLYKFVFMNADLSEREMLEETKKVLKSKKLVNVVRFEKNESRLHALLTFCMRMRLPKLFFSMMKGKWHG